MEKGLGHKSCLSFGTPPFGTPITPITTEVSPARKKALLQHCLGAERQRVLGTNNVDNDATCDEAVTLLNEHRARCSGCSYFAGATSFSESRVINMWLI